MEQRDEIMINTLPSKTWHWLRMNETALSWKPDLALCQTMIEGGKPTEILKETAQKIETGAGNGADPLFRESEEEGYGILADQTNLGETVRVIVGNREEGSEGSLYIQAEKQADITVVETFPAGEMPAKRLAYRTRVHAEAESRVRLVQVFMQGEGTELLNDIGCVCEQDAHFEILQMVIGRGDFYNGIRTDLEGDGSDVQIAIGYLGQKKQLLDMNLVVNHLGKKTNSFIQVDGTLKDAAQKIFRGTIDFKNGSSESKGAETENVLLLGDDVVNKTIPVILCAEEDVEGSHGATIGELDEDTLFYFASRGICAEVAEEIMTKGKMEVLYRKIQDAATETLVEQQLAEVMEYERA
ncbi:MAG: SufD family Fe-S cluster assembly protein [Clostridium sp.]|nr:SufD family Fe-S cluster assembly protein [Clostridium sp.]